ncbi:hypothetical protein ACFLSA_05045 [Bacteroidota bacterium]
MKDLIVGIIFIGFISINLSAQDLLFFNLSDHEIKADLRSRNIFQKGNMHDKSDIDAFIKETIAKKVNKRFSEVDISIVNDKEIEVHRKFRIKTGKNERFELNRQNKEGFKRLLMRLKPFYTTHSKYYDFDDPLRKELQTKYNASYYVFFTSYKIYKPNPFNRSHLFTLSCSIYNKDVQEIYRINSIIKSHISRKIYYNAFENLVNISVEDLLLDIKNEFEN